MSKYLKNPEKSIQKYRFSIQLLFVIICIWIGIEFYLFVNYLESAGSADFFNRPPGVEAFLPISSLMSVYYFLISGEIHSAHPAGFFIFLSIVSVSLVFGKSFCSWICPVGLLSELIGDFGERYQKKFFKKSLKLPRWLDYPLRSIKYLLLGFFIYAIFFTMTDLSLKYFLDSPYNIVADIKMYYFFANISKFSLIVISVLFLLSIVIRNFWCRYLCPYGALLGLASLLSFNKIKRNTETCIDCNLCAKACPSSIKVDKIKTVISDECSTCLSCVDACPVKDALEVKPLFSKWKINKKYIAIGVIVVYGIITGLGILSGNWQNNVSQKEYLHYFKNINSLGHPTSTDEIKKLNKKTNTGKTYGSK